ncbi:MAG: tetratricopeptide repeat protein [Candidatus Obscuribacterales bacterium]|nr:tetratricopeptide repeat protein [Candidatus Obscuribacterales bacterium]
MKYGTLSKLLILIPLSGAISLAANVADAHPPRGGKVLLAAGDVSGNITPEKIRGVVEMTLRQNWRPGGSGPEGGKAIVQFSLGSSGSIEGEPKLQQPSGQSAFDNICLDAIRKTSGLPPLPAYLGILQLPLVATFHSGKTSWLELGLADDSAGIGNSGSGSGSGSGSARTAGSNSNGSSSSGSGLVATAAGGLGQSEWTQPSGSNATSKSSDTKGDDITSSVAGQSDWVQPGSSTSSSIGGPGSSSGSSAVSSQPGQSGWTQPSSPSQSGWTQPAAAQPGQSGWNQPGTGGQQGNPQGKSWSQPGGAGQQATPQSASWSQPGGRGPQTTPQATGWSQSPQPTGQQMWNQQRGSQPTGIQALPAGGQTQSMGGELNAKPQGGAIAKGGPASKAPAVQAKKPGAKPVVPPKGSTQSKPSSLPGTPAGGLKAQTAMPSNVPSSNVPPGGGGTAFGSAPGGMTDMTGAQDLSQRVILLNNRAVVAINDNNYEGAIRELEEALKIDPTYQQARTNLAIAYNNYGLQLKNKPEDAIKIFHKAYALDPSNDKTKLNLDTIIQYMGKNPKVFKDRLDLGNRAVSQGDMSGAQVEYEAALAIKQDPIVQQKLQLVIAGAPPHVINAPPGGSSMPPQGMKQPQNGHAQQHPTHSTPRNPAGAQKQPIESAEDVIPGGPGTTGNPGTTGGPGTTGVSQKLDTMYRNLKSLEIKTFGKPFESDDVLSRLARLEQKLLGKVQTGKPMRRLDALLMSQ